MTNHLERFGIKHVSPSNINLWEACPSKWVANYLLPRVQGSSPAILRGILVEDGAMLYLTKQEPTIESATKYVLDRWDEEMPFAIDKAASRERAALPGMMQQAVAGLAGFGEVHFEEDGEQVEVKQDLDLGDFSIPMIGRLDFMFPEVKLVLDLKTTHAIPSQMRASHRRQRAFYESAMPDGYKVRFLYVSKTRRSMLSDGDIDHEMELCVKQTKRMNNFLSRCETVADALDTVHVDPDSFYWKGQEEQRMALYGM